MFHLEGSSIGRRWSRHGTMLHQLSQRVRGAQFLCDGKIRAFHDIFRPNLCCGITFKQNNALQEFCWLSKSFWAYVMSWLLWVYNMQCLEAVKLDVFHYVWHFFERYLHLHLSMVDLQIGSEDLSIRSWIEDHREVLEEIWTTPKLFCWKHTLYTHLIITTSLLFAIISTNYWFWFWFQLSSSMVQHSVSQ